MSLWITAGAVVGCWALLSLLSGERYRQQQELEAMKAAQQQALVDAEAADSDVSSH